jgi:hypothetical protein
VLLPVAVAGTKLASFIDGTVMDGPAHPVIINRTPMAAEMPRPGFRVVVLIARTSAWLTFS